MNLHYWPAVSDAQLQHKLYRSAAKWGKAKTRNLSIYCKQTVKWPCSLFHLVYNKNLQLELYTCRATATNYINRTAATITNSSQFTCLSTAPNVDEKRWEEKRKEEER